MMAAQIVQGMKCLHQYSLSGSWRVAWPWTYTTDPFHPNRMPGQEQEQEAILSFLKTEDELAKRSLGLSKGVTQPQASSSSDEDVPKSKKKKKKKKGKGGGKDKDNEKTED